MFRSRTQLAAMMFSLICLTGCAASRPMKYYVLDPGPVPAASGGAHLSRNSFGWPHHRFASLSRRSSRLRLWPRTTRNLFL